jgi:hypothetical protein
MLMTSSMGGGAPSQRFGFELRLRTTSNSSQFFNKMALNTMHIIYKCCFNLTEVMIAGAKFPLNFLSEV